MIAWSDNGVHLFRNGTDAVNDPSLASLKNIQSIAPGDYNNDGFPDLAVITDAGASLYTNQNGQFQKLPITLPAGEYNKAVWLDYDHDYDLDLVLLGENSRLARNNGEAGFSDRTEDFPFVDGAALDGVVLDLDPDGNGFDLVACYGDLPGVIYRDRLGGKYEAETIDNMPRGCRDLRTRDWNGDGWTDLIARAGNRAILRPNRKGQLELGSISLLLDIPGIPTEIADLDNSGIPDFLTPSGSVRPNSDIARKIDAIALARAVVEANFDSDGRVDIAAVNQDGSLHLLRNQTPQNNNWVQVGLTGVKNLKLAPGARVEVNAALFYF